MKKFQELLMEDLGWKLLSVVIAVIMWFMVINITQPVEIRSYSRNITLTNMDVLTERGLTVANAEDLENIKITIKIKAQRTALDRLTQSGDWLSAVVDLSAVAYAMDGDVITLAVEALMPNNYTNYTITSKTPAVAEIRIERLVSMEKPITLRVNGDTPSDLLLSAPQTSAQAVMVHGPASAVSQVDIVLAEINAQDIQGETPITSRLVAYDANGTPVKGVSLSLSEITVSYQIHITKMLPLQVNIVGAPADGYEVGSISCSPQQIEVTGSEKNLENLIYIQLDSLDISNKTGDIVETYDLQLYLPEGVYLRNSSIAQLTVTIERMQGRTITLESRQITLLNQNESMTYTIAGNIEIPVEAGSALLDNLDVTTIGATADVSTLAAGTHHVLVTPQLPSGITAGYAYASVTVAEKEPFPDESPSEGNVNIVDEEI